MVPPYSACKVALRTQFPHTQAQNPKPENPEAFQPIQKQGAQVKNGRLGPQLGPGINGGLA